MRVFLKIFFSEILFFNFILFNFFHVFYTVLYRILHAVCELELVTDGTQCAVALVGPRPHFLAP